MNSDDYIAWADEYREQLAVIEQKIKRKKEQLKSRFTTAKDRAIAERALIELYTMKNDCIIAAAQLEQKAKSMSPKQK